MKSENQKHSVINFYEFIDLQENLASIQQKLKEICQKHQLKGTILLAPEGANFGLSGDDEALKAAIEDIKQHTPFNHFDVKWSWGEQRPYPRMLVRIQDSILTFTENEDPSPNQVREGKRLDPTQWREMLTHPDVIVVDTRNEYEIEWGKFKNAQDLKIDKFSEFPEKFLKAYGDQKDKTYLLYCTGGIRCEKAVAWAQQKGFENTYQLDGGIVGYFEKEGGAEYEGSCFVFDRRWAISTAREEVHTSPQPDVRQPKQYFD